LRCKGAPAQASHDAASYISLRMRARFALLLLLPLALLPGCVPAGKIEEKHFELEQANRHNACNQQAWAKCQGAPDQDACVEREGLACDSRVDNTTDLDQEDPLPSGIEDSLPAEPR
jgi:hypothetical protein